MAKPLTKDIETARRLIDDLAAWGVLGRHVECGSFAVRAINNVQLYERPKFPDDGRGLQFLILEEIRTAMMAIIEELEAIGFDTEDAIDRLPSNTTWQLIDFRDRYAWLMREADLHDIELAHLKIDGRHPMAAALLAQLQEG